MDILTFTDIHLGLFGFLLFHLFSNYTMINNPIATMTYFAYLTSCFYKFVERECLNRSFCRKFLSCVYIILFKTMPMCLQGFPSSSTVKNPPVIQDTETWVQYLGLEDTMEEGMATHSSTPAWRSPWTEEPGGLQSIESQRVRHDWSNLA